MVISIRSFLKAILNCAALSPTLCWGSVLVTLQGKGLQITLKGTPPKPFTRKFLYFFENFIKKIAVQVFSFEFFKFLRTLFL